jgi:hypothetical protein
MLLVPYEGPSLRSTVLCTIGPTPIELVLQPQPLPRTPEFYYNTVHEIVLRIFYLPY